MKTKTILFLNLFLAPVLAAMFLHDPSTLILNFSFDINKSWIDLMFAMSYFSIPINTIYCFIIIFKKKENLRAAITYSLVGVFTSLTAGVFVMFWLEIFLTFFVR